MDHAHETNADNPDAYHCCNSCIFKSVVVFHAPHRSRRFGPFFHVFSEFFKVFFAPEPLKNAVFQGVF
jgi:hypothetical protein